MYANSTLPAIYITVTLFTIVPNAVVDEILCTLLLFSLIMKWHPVLSSTVY